MAVKTQPSSATKLQAKLLALMLLLAWKAEAANPVTCTALTTRYNTTVVCDFGLDISKSQHGFNVQFYDPDNTAQAKTVLACNFIKGGKLVCHEGYGMKFNKHEVSDQIQIIGPPAVDKVGGRYACQLAPAEGRIETCNLTYKDIPMEPPTSSKIRTPGNDSIDSTSSIVDLLKIIAGLLSVILIIIVIALSVCGVLYCKRERDRGSVSSRPPQGDAEASGSNGSRGARNKRSLSFFSWCGCRRGDEPQGQEGLRLTDRSATTEQPTDATSARPNWKTLCCPCIKSTPEESKENEIEKALPTSVEKNTSAEEGQGKDTATAETVKE